MSPFPANQAHLVVKVLPMFHLKFFEVALYAISAVTVSGEIVTFFR